MFRSLLLRRAGHLLRLASFAALLCPVATPAHAAVFVVNTLADSEANDGLCDAVECMLREAIFLAENNGEADLITFAVTGEIVLVAALEDLDTALTISGPGADQLTVTRGVDPPRFRIFTVTASADVVISELTVSGGHVRQGLARGGGILLQSGSLTLLDVVVADNHADSNAVVATAAGGGIFVDRGDLTIENSTISRNHTEAAGESSSLATGGGIAVENGDLTIEGSTISGNLAEAPGVTAMAAGGGIAVEAGASLAMRRSTVSGNIARSDDDSFGGGVAVLEFENTTAFESVTLAGNQAGAGANLATTNEVFLQNTILADPVASDNCYDSSTNLVSNGHNLASDDSCALDEPTDQPGTDPSLGPLAANGGATETHAIDAASPAFDQGFSNGLPTDQRGLPRVSNDPLVADAVGGDGADIGAFELQVAGAPGVVEIPTLGSWALLLLGLVLAGAGLAALRR
jgi:CSLREA domain-containing protein